MKVIVETQKYCHIINPDEIVYCKGIKGYTYLYLADGKELKISRSLLSFQHQLTGKAFICCYRSHLVNTNFIKSIHNTPRLHLHLANDHVVPVSAKKKKAVIKTIQQILQIDFKP